MCVLHLLCTTLPHRRQRLYSALALASSARRLAWFHIIINRRRVTHISPPPFFVSHPCNPTDATPPRQHSAKLRERCSDGVGDQGAEETSRGPERIVTSVLEAGLPCEGHSFQREPM